MRKGCLACAIKHVAQAQVLLDEAALGYPNHKWLACGHLAEAESELLGVDPELAKQIRPMRIAVAAGEDLPYDDVMDMLLLAKEKTEKPSDPLNPRKYFLKYHKDNPPKDKT